MLKRKTLCDNFVAERFLDGLRRNGLVLDAVVLLCALAVVEAVERADEIARDAADALEMHLFFLTAALRAAVADDAVVAADRVAVDRMVDRAVADAGFLHLSQPPGHFVRQLLAAVGGEGVVDVQHQCPDALLCQPFRRDVGHVLENVFGGDEHSSSP